MKYLDKQFVVPLTSQEYAAGWERIFAKKDEEPAPESDHRPRGNWVVCDGKYWVSWGPVDIPPSTETRFDILVPTLPPDPEGWQQLRYPTPEQFTEVINGMAQLLSKAEKESA